MNILPIVLIFLTIFSYVAVTFIKETKSICFLEKSLDGYERTERTLNNHFSRRAFKKIKTQPPPNSPNIALKPPLISNKKAIKPSNTQDAFFPPLELSKFNLAPLLKYENEISQHPLYKSFIEFIRLLYQKRLFSKEKKPETLATAIVQAILKKGKKIEEPALLAELYPDDPDLKELYYKMLKGTNKYSFTEGVPPLDHFVSLDSENKVAICVTFASEPLLTALFGEKTAKAIDELKAKKYEETQKTYFFSKQDLQSLYQTPMLSLLDPYLSDAKKFEPRESIGAKDSISGITIEKVL